MEAFIKACGGRKTVLAVILLIAGICVELLSAKGLTQNLLYLFGVLYGSFTVGNGVEHVQLTKRESMKVKPAKVERVDNSPELNSIKESVSELKIGITNQNEGIGYLVNTIRNLTANRPQ